MRAGTGLGAREMLSPGCTLTPVKWGGAVEEAGGTDGSASPIDAIDAGGGRVPSCCKPIKTRGSTPLNTRW